jgi:hypothetical protein
VFDTLVSMGDFLEFKDLMMSFKDSKSGKGSDLFVNGKGTDLSIGGAGLDLGLTGKKLK